MDFRPYQDALHNATLDALGRHRSVVCVAPTGTGKAVMAARLAAAWPGKRVGFLAHRRKLLTQAGDKIERITGHFPPLECGEERLSPEEIAQSKVVLMSKDSLHERRLEKFRPDWFDLVIVDEAHHASKGNKTYRRAIDHFGRNPDCKIVGYTATIDRSDSSPLIGPGRTFEACAYEYPLWSLSGKPNAIDDGWLVPLAHDYLTIEGLDFSHLKTVGGDWTDKSIEQVMIQEEQLHKVASALVEHVGRRPTIVFCATKVHADGLKIDGTIRPGMVDILNRYTKEKYGEPLAVSILGETPDEERERHYAAFRRREIQYLVGCDVMTEGLDLPEAECVAICRPTKSRNRFAQMAGRITRPLETIVKALNAAPSAEERRRIIAESDKPRGLVVDFVGCGGLQLAVSVADLLAEAEENETPVLKRAREKMSKKPSSGNVAEDFRQAVEEAQGELWAEATKVLLKDRARILARRVEYHAESLAVLGVRAAPEFHGERLHDAPTDKQVALLEGLGVERKTILGYSRKQAGAVINSLKDTRCTVKQAQVLSKFGYDPSGHNYYTAGELIDELAANGWRRPA